MADKPASIFDPVRPSADGKKRAVVVKNETIHIHHARMAFPEHRVIPVGGALTGWRFDEIVILVDPNTYDSQEQRIRVKDWLDQEVVLKLKLNGSIFLPV